MGKSQEIEEKKVSASLRESNQYFKWTTAGLSRIFDITSAKTCHSTSYNRFQEPNRSKEFTLQDCVSYTFRTRIWEIKCAARPPRIGFHRERLAVKKVTERTITTGLIRDYKFAFICPLNLSLNQQIYPLLLIIHTRNQRYILAYFFQCGVVLEPSGRLLVDYLIRLFPRA